MNRPGRGPLLLAAGCSFFVSALHLAIAAAGPGWYRYFGAPSLADQVERGSALVPTAMTLAIACVFVVWGVYGLSGAGWVRRLPLLRSALVAIGTVYVLRGAFLLPDLLGLWRGAEVPPRLLAFSAFSLVSGVLYLRGVASGWSALAGAR
ncbi:MAG: hypothetical protein AB2L07_04030 [Thermoanaerobaculaceae bacterium]